MKKALVVFMAVAMVFAFATSALAFSDVSGESAKTQDAINRFAAYGIINGYEDGTFLPNGTITRAEFAKIVVMYTGNTVLADALKNTPSEFTDVKTGEWYTGYINAATTLGYFKGMGDGTFGVTSTVTYGQALTALLRLAGFTDELPGSWPYNYVAQGSKSGYNLVKAVDNFDTYAPATRKDVVLMANTLLDSFMVAYDSDKKVFVKYEDNATVKGNYGVVNESGSATVTVAFDAKKGITINGSAIADNFSISNGYTILDVAGKTGNIIKNGDNEVVYIDLGSKYVKGIVTAVTDSTITVNGESYTKADGISGTATPGKYQELTIEDGEVTNVSAAMEETGNAMIVSKIEAKKLSGYQIKGIASIAIDEKKDYIVIKDGAIASIADIKVGDMVYARTAIGTAEVYEVISPAGDYAITSMTGAGGTAIDSFVVDGVTYKQSSLLFKQAADTAFDTMDANDYKDVKGVIGTFYTDKYGKAVAMVYGKLTAATTSVLGMIMDGTLYEVSTSGSGIGVGTSKIPTGYSDLTIITSAGETIKYNVFENGKAFFTAAAGEGQAVTLDGEAVVKGLFVKATLNEDGVITDMEAMAPETTTLGANAVNTKYNTVTIGTKVYSLAADTPVFMVTTKGEAPNKVVDKVTVSTGKDIIGSLQTIETFEYALNTNGTAIAYIVITDGKATEASKEYMVLDSLYYEIDYVRFADGTTFERAASVADNGAKKGDIVTYTLENGKIKKLTVVKALASMTGAVEVTSVAGNVFATASANYIMDADTVVFIYDKGNDDTTAKAFDSVGTTADIVSGAYVIVSAGADSVADYIIVVR